MTRSEFNKKFKTQSNWLLRNNPALLDKVFPRVQTRWTLELCKQAALKYTTKKEWEEQNTKSYQAATKYKWISECSKHMISTRTTWTIELCKEAALKYASRKEWEKQDVNSYQAAGRKKWLIECTKHMTPSLTAQKCVINLDTLKFYKSTIEAAKDVKIATKSIYGCCLNQRKTAGGYRWSYCDEQGNVLND